MRNLLSANFARLWRSKIFWVEMGMMFLWGALVLAAAYQSRIAYPEDEIYLSEYLFGHLPAVGGFGAVFFSLFFGPEYSDGTVRNKVVAGHSRWKIYLSNVLVGALAGVLVNLAWMAAVCLVGIPLLGWTPVGPWAFLTFLSVGILMTVAYGAIFGVVSMLVTGRGNQAVISMVLFLGILFLGSYCDNRLNEPEMYREGPVVSVVDGEPVVDPSSDLVVNADYVGGNARKVMEFVRDILPSGQGIEISHLEEINAVRMAFGSLGWIVVMTGAGGFLFKRKNLK